MFNKMALSTDSQLDHKALANSLLNQAIEQMVLLSGMSKKACESIIMSQFTLPSSKTDKNTIDYHDLVSQPESEYISQLFN